MMPAASDQIMVPAILSARQQSRRERAERLIEARLQKKDLSIGFICQELDMARTTLCRLFRQEGGVDQYIIGQRLDRIRDILLARSKYGNLNDLAHAWNFSDASHLTRRFKARYGWPPKRYTQLNAHLNDKPRQADISTENSSIKSKPISKTQLISNLQKEIVQLKILINNYEKQILDL